MEHLSYMCNSLVFSSFNVCVSPHVYSEDSRVVGTEGATSDEACRFATLLYQPATHDAFHEIGYTYDDASITLDFTGCNAGPSAVGPNDGAVLLVTLALFLHSCQGCVGQHPCLGSYCCHWIGHSFDCWCVPFPVQSSTRCSLECRSDWLYRVLVQVAKGAGWCRSRLREATCRFLCCVVFSKAPVCQFISLETDECLLSSHVQQTNRHGRFRNYL